ncbi:hypothetical protein ACIP93_28030 [Streptomyces sp. NPDC088745]|uniref:hypothetical protein n=1 Tax=Streptomyces sp. NPDC088745 TaxID=3365884 RepID=UPI0037F3D96F
MVARYAQRIHAERHAADPDLECLATCTTARHDAQKDVEALDDADEAETERVAALYEARFKEFAAQ